MDFLSQYKYILLFLTVGSGFIVVTFTLSRLLRSRSGNPLLNTVYECGIEPVGIPWVKLNVRFYVFALLFLLFDVETIFIYPWALIFRELGIIGLVEMCVFIFVLGIGLLYCALKGALKWY